jgi:hypothetical protein
VIPNQAIPNRVNQTRAIQNRHRVNRLARVDRRRIRAIQRQATQVDRAQAKAPRAAVIPDSDLKVQRITERFGKRISFGQRLHQHQRPGIFQ